MDIDLGKRLFNFAIDVIKICRKLPKAKEYDIIKNQLIKSSSSSRANYEEAQGARSKSDFTNKINISLKEIRESNYWLRILKEISDNNADVERLICESTELKKILGSIYSKSSRNIN